MIKYLYVILRSGDSNFSIPTFDFYFKVQIPKANKERIILVRDEFGRIISSKVQEHIYV